MVSDFNISDESVDIAMTELAGATKLWKMQGKTQLAHYVDTLIAATGFNRKTIQQLTDENKKLKRERDEALDYIDMLKERQKLRITGDRCMEWISVEQEEPPTGIQLQGWFDCENCDGGFWEPNFINDEDRGIGLYGRIDYDEEGYDYGLTHLTLTHWAYPPEKP